MMRGVDGIRQRQRDEAVAWLRTADARSAAARLLERHGIHDAIDVDDVLQLAAEGVLTTFAERSDPYEEWRAPGFAYQVLKHQVLGLLRGSRSTAGLDELGEVADPPAPAADDAEDRVRAALDGLLAVPAWLGAAALADVTLVLHGDGLDLEGVPSPLRGARPDQARLWAALWFGGWRHGFPDHDGDGDPSGRRKARSRACERVRKVLAQAAGAVALGSHADV